MIFLKVSIFIFLFIEMGLSLAIAQPKKGIIRISFFIILLVGMNSVWRKKDSHGLWWLAAITKGVLGRFSIPFLFQLIPHNTLSTFKISKIQTLPTYWSFDVERNSYATIIIKETKRKLIRKTKYNIKILIIWNY